MKRGVWVEPYEAEAGFYCDACSKPTPYRWGIVVKVREHGSHDSGYFCTRHMRQLVKSWLRSERLPAKRRKR